jgi:hypothetical protein
VVGWPRRLSRRVDKTAYWVYQDHIVRKLSLRRGFKSHESVSIHPGLQLVRGLWAPLEVALLETPVDTDGKVVRDLKEKYAVIT